MNTDSISRRHFLRLGAGLVAAPAVLPLDHITAVVAPHIVSQPPPTTPIKKAYHFLDSVMDLYAADATTGLQVMQSYLPTSSLDLGDVAFTYDNALAIIALTHRNHGDDLSRATILGNAFLFAQQHDPHYTDGRVRDSYHANGYVTSDGHANVAGPSTSTGNMAWAGLALLHLYKRTKDVNHLTGAMALASWIYDLTYDTRGAGGYTGGVDGNGTAHAWKSTEHNIDIYAFFTALAQITKDQRWATRAGHALSLIRAMWDASTHHFWTGTGNDGATLNTDVIPEDAQSWAYLATGTAAYGSSLLWVKQHLAVTDGAFKGFSFSNADVSHVWFEGTAHMAAAYHAAGDGNTAKIYVKTLEAAQKSATNTDGYGIVAASADGLQTGFGDSYYTALHVGATAWYCLAKLKGNPFRL